MKYCRHQKTMQFHRFSLCKIRMEIRNTGTLVILNLEHICSTKVRISIRPEIPQICGFHSYGDPYFGRAYSSIFSTVFGTCSTDLHTDFAHRKSMKLHRFLMCTIFHIYNVTVVASVVIQFDTKIRNNQHIYNTLLVNTTTWYFLLVLDPAGTQITQPHSHTKGRQC